MPWAVFAVVVAAMLAIDLGVAQRKAHVVHFREALIWSAVWVVVSMVFAAGVYFWRSGDMAMAFLAGYLVEKALSVDNLFVFLVLFQHFAVPRELEHKVLFWGVLGALAMRAVLIAAGLGLLHMFHSMIYVFGLLLIATGLRLAFNHGPSLSPEQNPLLRWLRSHIPMTKGYEGAHLVVKRGGRWFATPLVAVLVAVETTDLLFAIDSIPAVLAISNDPFVVYTSNVFALLGMRAMYFALAGFMARLRYFSLGLAAVLVFVGIKMLLSEIHPVSVPFSLAVFAGLVAVAVVASLLDPDAPKPTVRATPLMPEDMDASLTAPGTSRDP